MLAHLIKACLLLPVCLPLAAESTPAQPPAVGEAAGDFTVTGADGPLSLSELNARSEGPVVAVFARGAF